jgi:Starch-binding associating with outer membrane/Susd and RagB outer membrane lipoprotein
LLSYNLTPADYNGLWTITYQDPLRDFKYVIDETEGNDQMAYFNAAAKIMTAFNYMKLVDTFGDIPYTQALRGEEGLLTPEYDDAAAVYQALITSLGDAITQIDQAQFPLRLTYQSDPLFGAIAPSTADRTSRDQMLDWKRFANSLRLKMLVRIGDATALGTLPVSFSPVFNIAGDASSGTKISGGSAFLADDAIVDPGYELNRPNPAWATWGKTVAGALANSSRVPTTFSFAFYNGSKISDGGRGETIYVNYPTTPNNQLGNEVGNPTIVAGLVTWASNQAGLEGTGVLKGPAMGQPLMLLAESNFLLAEAQLNGDIAGSFTTTYYDGITASFSYLYKDEQEVLRQAVAPLVTAYLSTNDDNRLVEIEAATTDAQRLEAIITQKYIAMNMITSDESYNEFRRTGFPVTVPGGAPALDIASNKSTITSRFDRLPTRVMYPSSEQSFNSANYRDVDFRSELMFWDPN